MLDIIKLVLTMLNNVLIRLIKQPKKYVIIHLLLFKVSSYLPRFIIDTLLGQTNAFNLGLIQFYGASIGKYVVNILLHTNEFWPKFH